MAGKPEVEVTRSISPQESFRLTEADVSQLTNEWWNGIHAYVNRMRAAWEKDEAVFADQDHAQLIGYLVQRNEAHRQLRITPVYSTANGVFALLREESSVTTWVVSVDARNFVAFSPSRML